MINDNKTMDAVLEVVIRRIDGGDIGSHAEVLPWLVGDGIYGLEQRDDQRFQFRGCSRHLPEDCECSEPDALYMLEIASAGGAEEMTPIELRD